MIGSRMRESADGLLSALDSACAVSATESEMVAALREYGSVKDRLDAAGVRLVGAMVRRGVFAEHGVRREALVDRVEVRDLDR